MTSTFSIVQVVCGFAAEFRDARVKVSVPYQVKGRWTYRRFGREYGPEPTELALSDLGSDAIKIAESIITLATDRPEPSSLVYRLSVVLVLPDGTETTVGEPLAAELFAFVAAGGVAAD